MRRSDTAMRRQDYIQLVEDQYFGNVTAGNIDAVCACFTADATITILHGDNPPRRFFAQPTAGELHLSEFWRHLCAHYEARFEHYDHVIDVDAKRCAATFTVTLSPKPGSPYATRGTLTLRNCNFFWLRDSLIERMTVYYANPETGGTATGKPTGYPPA